MMEDVMKICKIYGCNNKAEARGLCKTHWQRWRKHGDANIVIRKTLPKQCEVPGCDRKPHARWEGKALCNMHYLRIWSYGSTEKREKVFNEWSMCCVDGCDKPARSPGKNLMCEMHYYRKRRTGSVDIIKRSRAKNNYSKDYIKLHEMNHPMSCSKNGMIYEHRKVLFDKIGWGPHKCFWCGEDIDWMPGERNKKGCLVVDHFNGNKRDNESANLIPSCHRCNAMRGLFQRWVTEHGEDAMMLIRKWNSGT
jgi:hypothetical protein